LLRLNYQLYHDSSYRQTDSTGGAPFKITGVIIFIVTAEKANCNLGLKLVFEYISQHI